MDTDSKPFQLGMLKELLKKSSRVTAVYDKAQTDPSLFLLSNGESAFNLIGCALKKKFNDGKYYMGKVTQVIPPDDDEAPGAA